MYIKQDAWSKFFSTPLYDFNPESLLFLKQSGDAGYLAERDRLFAAMYGEWDVLLKDVNKMCNAVSTLNYTVVPTIEEGNEAHATAQKVADIVKKALWMRSPNNELGEWRHTFLQMIGTLYHAICRSVNVHEIIWERSAGLVYPRCYAPVQPNYYGWAVQAKEPDRLVLFRDGNPYGKGEPFPKGKFIVAINPNGPDHPMRAAQFISLVGWFGAAKWGLPWLMKYCQVFGLPWRKFTVGSEEDKAAKLAELASNPVISDTVVFGDENVEIINAAASGASIPQAEILRLAENACHKLILGQTLTSDTSDNGGSLAQAKVHAGVMADEVMYVGNYVCEILNQQLIPEIVRANFGAIPVELIPELRCAVPQAEANLDQLQMYKGLQEMGVRLVEADVCDKFGVPIAGPDDKVLEPAGQQAAQPGMPGEVPQPDDEPPSPGPQKPTLAEELNNEPIEAAAAPDVPDIDALSAAAEAAAEDAHRRWSEPFFKALASALDQGMTPSEILSSLEGWNPDTEALADALAVTARVSLGHGPDDIEAACNQHQHAPGCNGGSKKPAVKKKAPAPPPPPAPAPVPVVSSQKAISDAYDALINRKPKEAPSTNYVSLQQMDSRTQNEIMAQLQVITNGQAVAKLKGMKLAETQHSISNDKVWHAMKGHPNLTKSDLEKIPDIVKNWDTLQVKDRTKNDFYRVIYTKKYPGKEYLYVEQLRPSSRSVNRSYFVTLYII